MGCQKHLDKKINPDVSSFFLAHWFTISKNRFMDLSFIFERKLPFPIYLSIFESQISHKFNNYQSQFKFVLYKADTI